MTLKGGQKQKLIESNNDFTTRREIVSLSLSIEGNEKNITYKAQGFGPPST
jgi:hypothetical protein